jgi:capsular polysaccharide biosynthesis protein
MESQSNQTNVRLLSPAIEALYPSQRKVMVGVIGSLIGGFILAAALSIALELFDRRVRSTDDLWVVSGVNVIGVLHPIGAKRSAFRPLGNNSAPPPGQKPLLPMAGVR